MLTEAFSDVFIVEVEFFQKQFLDERFRRHTAIMLNNLSTGLDSMLEQASSIPDYLVSLQRKLKQLKREIAPQQLLRVSI
jgi:hypothetical protein